MGRGLQRLAVDGHEVADLRVADRYLLRLRGLLGRRVGETAMWLTPCNSVHGLGMLVSLDVAQLDAQGTVVRVGVLRPFGLLGPRRGVTQVVEARRGMFERWGVREGRALSVAPR